MPGYCGLDVLESRRYGFTTTFEEREDAFWDALGDIDIEPDWAHLTGEIGDDWDTVPCPSCTGGFRYCRLCGGEGTVYGPRCAECNEPLRADEYSDCGGLCWRCTGHCVMCGVNLQEMVSGWRDDVCPYCKRCEDCGGPASYNTACDSCNAKTASLAT